MLRSVLSSLAVSRVVLLSVSLVSLLTFSSRLSLPISLAFLVAGNECRHSSPVQSNQSNTAPCGLLSIVCSLQSVVCDLFSVISCLTSTHSTQCQPNPTPIQPNQNHPLDIPCRLPREIVWVS